MGTPWYKHRWPWFLMAGPVAVVVAGIVTVWLAVQTEDGMVVITQPPAKAASVSANGGRNE